MHIGSNHIHFKTIDSTNVYAMSLLSKTNPIHGTVISADFQTNGRGQIGRKWQSDPNQNIAISIILHPHFLNPQDQFALSKAIALGVVDFLNSFGLDNISIKWPNDIYINDKKVGGILIQNILSGSKYQTAIIGIGLNVLQKEFNHSLSNPTSLAISGFKGIIDDDFYQNLFGKLEYRYQQLQKNSQKIHDDYYLFLYRIKEWSMYCELDERPFMARLIGTDSIGRMIVERESGHTNHYSIGEIKLVI
jgi:BirA family biotin operon repressor/biotin-[acetyl-CoA-carboxylase] ligase